MRTFFDLRPVVRHLGNVCCKGLTTRRQGGGERSGSGNAVLLCREAGTNQKTLAHSRIFREKKGNPRTCHNNSGPTLIAADLKQQTSLDACWTSDQQTAQQPAPKWFCSQLQLWFCKLVRKWFQIVVLKTMVLIAVCFGYVTSNSFQVLFSERLECVSAPRMSGCVFFRTRRRPRHLTPPTTAVEARRGTQNATVSVS